MSAYTGEAGPNDFPFFIAMGGRAVAWAPFRSPTASGVPFGQPVGLWRCNRR